MPFLICLFRKVVVYCKSLTFTHDLFDQYLRCFPYKTIIFQDRLLVILMGPSSATTWQQENLPNVLQSDPSKRSQLFEQMGAILSIVKLRIRVARFCSSMPFFHSSSFRFASKPEYNGVLVCVLHCCSRTVLDSVAIRLVYIFALSAGQRVHTVGLLLS